MNNPMFQNVINLHRTLGIKNRRLTAAASVQREQFLQLDICNQNPFIC